MTDSRINFKDMCEKFDVTARTLRYYEYIELLNPEREGRSRFYNSRDCARMTLILRGRKYGFSLEAIRQWLDIYDDEGSDAQMKIWVENADAQLDELKSQRAQIDETIEELQSMRDRTAASLEAFESSDKMPNSVKS